LAVVEEAVRAGVNAASIGRANVAFDAEHPFPNLIIVADVAAGDETGKVGVDAAAISKSPISVSSVRSEICTPSTRKSP
jgi:hypothetical protein